MEDDKSYSAYAIFFRKVLCDCKTKCFHIEINPMSLLNCFLRRVKILNLNSNSCILKKIFIFRETPLINLLMRVDNFQNFTEFNIHILLDPLQL